MPNDIQIVTESDLRRVAGLNIETVDVIEKAFATLATGDVVMPPILSMDIPDANGEVDVKTAYLPGFDSFAIKVSPGFFDNPKLGLPSLNGLMILFSAKTGLVEAVFLDNGYLTNLRTAAAGAVAARHMAIEEVETAGVIGTGVQARLQMRAAHLVRPYKRLLVHGRDTAKAAACAADLGRDLDVEVEVMTSAGDVVRESQLVVTTTPSKTPLVKSAWLHPGLHITAVGSDQTGKNEIAADALASADLYVCDRVSQCEIAGELAAARAAGEMLDVQPPELGDIITGRHPGRETEEAITICDLTGTGAQDTAIANHVYRQLGSAGTIVAA